MGGLTAVNSVWEGTFPMMFTAFGFFLGGGYLFYEHWWKPAGKKDDVELPEEEKVVATPKAADPAPAPQPQMDFQPQNRPAPQQAPSGLPWWWWIPIPVVVLLALCGFGLVFLQNVSKDERFSYDIEEGARRRSPKRRPSPGRGLDVEDIP